MQYIGKIKEVYGEGYPALSELISNVPLDNKEKILQHMKKAEITSAAAGVFRDVLTGVAIPGQALCLTDGKYGWRSDVTYYVEKYNMKLPQEFIDHILAQ